MTSEDGISFSELLLREMETAGLTQAELARRLAERFGRTTESWRREVGRWTRGEVAQPQRETIVRLADVLGVELERISPTGASPGLSARLAAIERRLGELAIVVEENAESIGRLAGLEVRLRDVESRLLASGI